MLTPLAKRFPTPAGEVGSKDGRLHSCRHYFASRCAADGYAEQLVMTWLGHIDSKVTRRYFHQSTDTTQRHMGRPRLFGEAGGAVATGMSTSEVPEPRRKKARKGRL